MDEAMQELEDIFNAPGTLDFTKLADLAEEWGDGIRLPEYPVTPMGFYSGGSKVCDIYGADQVLQPTDYARGDDYPTIVLRDGNWLILGWKYGIHFDK